MKKGIKKASKAASFLIILALIITSTAVQIIAQESIQSSTEITFPVEITLQAPNSISEATSKESMLTEDEISFKKPTIQENISIRAKLKDEFKTYNDYEISIIEVANNGLIYYSYHDKNDIISIDSIQQEALYKINVKVHNDSETREFSEQFIVTKNTILVSNVQEITNENQTSEPILENVNLYPESLSVVYEMEINDCYYNANTVNVNQSVYGYISTESDVDCFKLNNGDGKVINLYLGVPVGVDYDLYIYENNLNNCIARGYNGTGLAENVNFLACSNTTYYFVIKSYRGCSIEQSYFLNITPTTINPYSFIGSDWCYFFAETTINNYISSNYGTRNWPSDPEHQGFDIKSNSNDPIEGDEILSVTKGKVKNVYLNPNKSPGNYMGFAVIIQTYSKDPFNGEYLTTSYMHMKDVPFVVENQEVKEGTKLGLVGGTQGIGRELLERHLHFQVSRGAYSNLYTRNVNPIWFFPQISFTGDTSIDPHSFDGMPASFVAIVGSTSSGSASVAESAFVESALNQDSSKSESFYLIDISLINYVGKDRVMNWIEEVHKNNPDYKISINDFRKHFGITDELFMNITKNSNNFYNIEEVISDLSIS